MVANWACVLAELHSKALTHGVLIAEHRIADGEWHRCDTTAMIAAPVVMAPR
jgi:hypothetical protein